VLTWIDMGPPGAVPHGIKGLQWRGIMVGLGQAFVGGNARLIASVATLYTRQTRSPP